MNIERIREWLYLESGRELFADPDRDLWQYDPNGRVISYFQTPLFLVHEIHHAMTCPESALDKFNYGLKDSILTGRKEDTEEAEAVEAVVIGYDRALIQYSGADEEVVVGMIDYDIPYNVPVATSLPYPDEIRDLLAEIVVASVAQLSPEARELYRKETRFRVDPNRVNF